MTARWAWPLLLASLLAGTAAAQANSTASATSGEVRPPACVKLQLQEAGRALQSAAQLYQQSHTEEARKALTQLVDATGRATECALARPRTQKHTEIELRRLMLRMIDLERSLEAEEQPFVARAVHEVDRQHDRLMQQLFGAAYGHTEKPR